MKRSSAIVAGALALTIGPAPYAQVTPIDGEMPDMFEEFEVFVCPDGGYQSGCDASDIEAAVKLEGAQSTDFAQRCLFDTKADCAVIASGQINRFSDVSALHWQLLGLQPEDGPYAEMLVLAELGGPFPSPLLTRQVDGYFDAPFAARDGDGRFILHAPARNRGLGNADLVLFTSGKGWNWTGAASLMREIDRLLPEGFTTASPVNFNFREGSAFALVRRADDAGCCATGGTVVVDFEQTDNNLSVIHVSFTETHPGGKVSRAAAEDQPVTQEIQP